MSQPICTKRGYVSWRNANFALLKLRKAGKTSFRSYYECPLCNNWHLSKVAKTPKSDKKHKERAKKKKLDIESEYWEDKLNT